MGNTASNTSQIKTKHIFENELSELNAVVNNIINDEDLFKNKNYNFLSKDVCNQHYILMESELSKHLKVNLGELGMALYLIPKHDEARIEKSKVNKKEICQKISHHYMKILYILCLIKYVYNLEQYGDFSISGIIFRNIKIVENIMEINFCNVPQKDYNKQVSDAYKMDFGKLEGLKFLTQYFLDNDESSAFIKVMRSLLARSGKSQVKSAFCKYATHGAVSNIKELEKMYLDKYNEKLVCKDTEDTPKEGKNKRLNLFMYVEKDNTIFSKEYCYEMHKLVIPLSSSNGKKVNNQYKVMKENYKNNISNIQRLLNMLVTKNANGDFELKDVSQQELNDVIENVKTTIKTYYIQSILDYQLLLDIGKATPNINMIK